MFKRRSSPDPPGRISGRLLVEIPRQIQPADPRGGASPASARRDAESHTWDELNFPTPYYYDGIVGAARCEKLPKRCDLSQGIVAADAAMTVTFHLIAPDPEFLSKLALPFAYLLPARTPPRPVGTHALPATGPYMIVSYRPKRVLEFVRNPYFREWSKAAQPDGYPDRIVVRIGGTADGAIDEVIRGQADAFSTAQSETPLPRPDWLRS